MYEQDGHINGPNRKRSVMFKYSKTETDLPYCVAVQPPGKRLVEFLWAILSGILTAVAIAIMTDAPWLSQRTAQLLAWLENGRALLP